MSKITPHTTVTDLTPEAARRLLANNSFNRPLQNKRITAIARIISEGRWIFNGASIVIDTKSRLLDGQHRCHAVIRANKKARTVLVTGVNPKAFDTIDQGAKRSGADIFHMCGVSNAGAVSASLTYIYQDRKGYTLGSSTNSELPDMNERTKLFDSMPGYEQLVKNVCHYRKDIGGSLPNSVLAGMCYLFQEKHKLATDRFLLDFASRKIAKENNPACVVRSIFDDLKSQGYKVSRQSKCAYLKLAWNAFVAGQHVDEINLPGTLDIPINSLTSRYWLDH